MTAAWQASLSRTRHRLTSYSSCHFILLDTTPLVHLSFLILCPRPSSTHSSPLSIRLYPTTKRKQHVADVSQSGSADLTPWNNAVGRDSNALERPSRLARQQGEAVTIKLSPAKGGAGSKTRQQLSIEQCQWNKGPGVGKIKACLLAGRASKCSLMWHFSHKKVKLIHP